MRLVMGGDGRRVASRHGFAIARLDARLSVENAERNARLEVPGWSGGSGVGDLGRPSRPHWTLPEFPRKEDFPLAVGVGLLLVGEVASGLLGHRRTPPDRLEWNAASGTLPEPKVYALVAPRYYGRQFTSSATCSPFSDGQGS
jgi:hypothetical protein